MRSHAKASTAGSAQRPANGLGRNRFAQTAVFAFAIAALLAFAATSASASLLRNHESSFGAFTGADPRAITVDQSNGDIYVISTATNKVSRFNASGLPKNFTAGPNAGTNTLTGLGFQNFPSYDQVAIDNSGGPSDGNIYVTQSGSGQVNVFASSGEPLGSLSGSGTPAGSLGEHCGIAVDQANGDLYIASYENRVWRYSPSGATVVEGDYSGGIATSINPCQLAVAQGSIYVHNWKEGSPEGAGPVRKYVTANFATGAPPSPSFTVFAAKASALATDPSNGDVYVDEGDKVTVYSAAGSPLYSFGSGDFGTASAGVAVRAGGNAYVSDPANHEVDVYETTLEPGNRASLFSFGAFTAEDPRAIAVDQSNGDLYVISTATNTLSRFNSSGLPKDFTAGPDAGTNTLTGLGLLNFPSFDQVAIDNSGGPSDGNIYVTQSGSGQVKVFASSGEPLGSLNGSGTPGSFGEDCGIAVDQANGDLYIASYENRVWRYSPSGATVVEGDYSGGIATTINPCQLAVAQGSLYAHNWKEGPPVGPGPVRKYATADFATGAPPSAASTVFAAKAFAIAADPSNGDVYVDEGDKVTVYGSNGALQYSFGSGDFGTASAGVAVRSGGNAYVSDPANHEVDVYGPFSAPPPIVETKAATGVKHTKATLHGHLDPNDSLPITGCEFELGTDTSYGEAPVPCAEGSSFGAPADVSAELTGLTPGTTYHFRLHVTTGAGGFDGDDQSFETTPPSSTPEAATGKGTILSSTSSELKGTVNPNANALTDCHFEYVDDIPFQATGFSGLSSGGSVPCDQAPGSIPVDFEEHEVSATVTGLDPERIYRFRLVAENANGAGNGSEALVPGPPLVETTGSPTRTATTARFDSRVSAHGAATTYHFEYVTEAEFEANGFDNAVSTPDVALAIDEVQKITVGGTEGEDQFKLRLGGDTTPDITVGSSAEEVQAALRALPSVGSPNVRVSRDTDASFGGYVVTFVGALANSDVNQVIALPGTNPPNVLFVRTQVDGGPGDASRLVSAQVANLQPATAYRYRIVADNGTPGGASTGEAMTLRTRGSDAPLGHGHLPGPPGSDRAWEQVNVSDTGGNNVSPDGISGAFAISDDGNRAIYNIVGGSPGSEAGGDANQQFAERTASGWETSLLYPTRSQAKGNSWFLPWGRSDLSQLLVVSYDTASTNTDNEVWRLSPGAPAQHVYSAPHSVFGSNAVGSDDGSRVVARLAGSLDPDHPVSSPFPRDENLYDVTSGTPRLASLLPDGSVPSCGAGLGYDSIRRSEHWLTADGSYLLFMTIEGSGVDGCAGTEHLYVRDLEAETTDLIATSVRDFVRSTADAAFFTTDEYLDPDDEGGLDLYRYGFADHSFECVTCFGGLTTDVVEGTTAVSEDGSRAYFVSPRRLLPGAAARPFPDAGIYRVLVASGELAYVGPGKEARAWGSVGNAITPDGSVFVFRSDSPALNSLNGPQNGGTHQYYRYDDDDRSLVCVSCPADGSSPRGQVNQRLTWESGPNTTALADTGDLAFTTPTALVAADQNTARAGRPRGEGTDVYEWRDGRQLLVTDGLAVSEADEFGDRGPAVIGISRDGRDVFFAQSAQLTPDAIDSFSRLYDARIGGGFEFPTPPPPCSLEACQGTPRGVPEEPRPGSLDFSGSGNSQGSRPARCRKGKVRRSGRCVAKHKKRAKRAHNRANNDRRASR